MTDSDRSNAQPLSSSHPGRSPASSQAPEPEAAQASSSHHLPSSHSRTSSSASSRLRSPAPPSRTPIPAPDKTQDVLTAGDGLASDLGIDSSTSSQGHARRPSSSSAKSYAKLSGPSAHGGSGASAGNAGEGLTGFDPAKGYQESGSGGAFTASGGLEPVPFNAPALMYGGGGKG